MAFAASLPVQRSIKVACWAGCKTSLLSVQKRGCPSCRDCSVCHVCHSVSPRLKPSGLKGCCVCVQDKVADVEQGLGRADAAAEATSLALEAESTR